MPAERPRRVDLQLRLLWFGVGCTAAALAFLLLAARWIDRWEGEYAARTYAATCLSQEGQALRCMDRCQSLVRASACAVEVGRLAQATTPQGGAE